MCSVSQRVARETVSLAHLLTQLLTCLLFRGTSQLTHLLPYSPTYFPIYHIARLMFVHRQQLQRHRPITKLLYTDMSSDSESSSDDGASSFLTLTLILTLTLTSS